MSWRRRLPLALLALVLAAGAAGAEPHALERAPASFRGWVESLPEDQRERAERRLSEMPPQRRDRLFQRWDALGEGERRALQERMQGRLERGAGGRERMRERVESLSPESRENLAPLMRRWRSMPPDERHRMRRRLERFRTLAPEDQQALIERKFEGRPPEERARILDSLREASRALPARPLLDVPEAPPDSD
jgi:hypothetical protein